MRLLVLTLIGVGVAATVDAAPLRWTFTGTLTGVTPTLTELLTELTEGATFAMTVELEPYEPEPTRYVSGSVLLTMPQLVVRGVLPPFVDPLAESYWPYQIGATATPFVPTFVDALTLNLGANRLGTFALSLALPTLSVVTGQIHTFQARTVEPVPEPATILLTLIGLGAGAVTHRRRHGRIPKSVPRRGVAAPDAGIAATANWP